MNALFWAYIFFIALSDTSLYIVYPDVIQYNAKIRTAKTLL